MAKKKYPTVVEQLQKKSADAISTVMSMLDSLRATNDEATEAYNINVRVISSLEEENKQIEQMKSSNTKIIQNFENLLN